jgi:GT2 family glycosyltransferase
MEEMLNSEPQIDNISVIICTYTINRLNDVNDVLASLMLQNLKPSEIIITVDNNDELYQILQARYNVNKSISQLISNNCVCVPSNSESQISIKIIENNGALGLSETRNVSIKAAHGDIIAFIDDDAVADREWLHNLTKHFKSSNVMAVGGKAVPVWLNGLAPPWFPEELAWTVGCTYKGLPVKALDLASCGSESERGTIRNVPGCNMAFRRKAFEEVGLFRPDIGGIKETPRAGEEADLCLRIKNQMTEAFIIHEPGALIHHKVSPRKARFSYVIYRSFNEGLYKAKVRKIHRQIAKKKNSAGSPGLKAETQQILSTESSYLRYLLFIAIPTRLRKFYSLTQLLQASTIMASILATGMGYLAGNLKSE